MAKKSKALEVAQDVAEAAGEEVIFTAVLTPAQLLSQSVVLEMKEPEGMAPQETKITLPRELLTPDYERKEGAAFRLTITRIS